MRSKAVRMVTEHWKLGLYTVFCVALAISAVVYSKDIGLRIFDFMAANQDKKLSGYIEKEKAQVSESVLLFSKNTELRSAVEKEDGSTISALLDAEKKRGKLTALTVSDENGTTLSRTAKAAGIGDNVFLTNPLGRQLMERGEAVGFSVGRNFPLTLGAGQLLTFSDGTPSGSIFGGYWLDNAYAIGFKETYLHDWRQRQVVFYSKEEGVTGDSFNNPDIENKLHAYISHASVLIQDGRSGDLLNIDGTDYVVTNHLLSDDNDIYGGILLLTPLPLTLGMRSMLASALFAVLFLASLLFLERISISKFIHFTKRYLDTLLLTLSGIVFLSLWFGIYAYGKSSTMYISEPEFTIYNSTMKIRPGAGVYTIGYSQQAAVMIYSGGEEINAVEAHLRFDPKVIKVDTLSFNRSVCGPSTIIEQAIDNTNGTVSIACAITDKAFVGTQGVITDINFTPLRAGNAALSFDDDTHVLAADGLGTDVLRSVTSAYYRVFDEKDLSGFFSKEAIIIPYSPTHENSSKWYSSRRIVIVWPKMKGANYIYELSQDATTTIANPQETSATTVTLTAPNDGIYYFKLAPKQGEAIGQVVRLRIQIDTTPPDVPLVKASSLLIKKDDIVRFVLDSSDELSGLQKNFYVQIDGSTWLPTFSKIYMPFHEAGTHTLGVRVFDNAENYSDTEVTVKVKN